MMKQQEESWILHLSVVWSMGFFPPSFLHFFSISGMKLIKISAVRSFFSFFGPGPEKLI